MKSITVYCGASDDVDQFYLDAAFQMGIAIAQRGIQLVYGGGSTGLMGAVANGALSEGGEVVGIIPEFFNTKEKAHDRLTRLEVVADMHQRKARMAELVEGFIALPGGFGTLEELFEALTWSHIGLHNKPIGILNFNGYYDHLLTFLDNIYDKGFAQLPQPATIEIATTPKTLLKLLDRQPRAKITNS